MQILKNKLLKQDLEDMEEKVKGELEALSKRKILVQSKQNFQELPGTQEEYENNIMSYGPHYLINRCIQKKTFLTQLWEELVPRAIWIRKEVKWSVSSMTVFSFQMAATVFKPPSACWEILCLRKTPPGQRECTSKYTANLIWFKGNTTMKT